MSPTAKQIEWLKKHGYTDEQIFFISRKQAAKIISDTVEKSRRAGNSGVQMYSVNSKRQLERVLDMILDDYDIMSQTGMSFDDDDLDSMDYADSLAYMEDLYD